MAAGNPNSLSLPFSLFFSSIVFRRSFSTRGGRHGHHHRDRPLGCESRHHRLPPGGRDAAHLCRNRPRRQAEVAGPTHCRASLHGNAGQHTAWPGVPPHRRAPLIEGEPREAVPARDDSRKTGRRLPSRPTSLPMLFSLDLLSSPRQRASDGPVDVPARSL